MSSTAPNSASAEQRELVRRIKQTKDFYEILGVQKDADVEMIKRAYKKLALKLHPDKNTAVGAEEAFKAVSKAFSCLSDPQKRAAYDRYGEDGPAGLSQRHANGAGTYYHSQGFDDFDPEQIFHMFFGGGGFGPGATRFHAHFGGQPPPQRQRPAGGAQQGQANPLLGLLQLLPVVLLLLFTFFSSQSEPVYSLHPQGEFTSQHLTRRFAVPFFSKHSFEREYPSGSSSRIRLEQRIESEYKEQVETACYRERLEQQRLFRWGYRQRARDMQMPNCDEMQNRFGYRFPQYA